MFLNIFLNFNLSVKSGINFYPFGCTNVSTEYVFVWNTLHRSFRPIFIISFHRLVDYQNITYWSFMKLAGTKFY